ncbi:MAG: phage tail tape measure protein [Flavobacterium nitrogenifigens]|uniref:phage tail tape measure protein n=1 Tax=Flavobacterium nitrogenifigens TaxID=1617283 RepID=UPI002807A60F|nr:phage tail tape measure protein [Flavobacterium nitrogenifigens]MDQ8012042.1 phage tail tape measure protein [Flavobacterium nitrogenifigens]
MDTTTSWILDFVDHITKPVKDVMKAIGKMTDSLEEVSDTVKLSEKDTKIALQKSKEYYKELEKSIKEVEQELKELEKTKKSGSWTEQQKANAAYDKAKAKVENYRKALQGAEEDIKDLQDQVDKFKEKADKWTDLVTGINQGLELIGKATDALDFNVDVQNLTVEVQRMTDLTGDALDDFVRRSRKIADVYDEDAQDIARAANAMTKQNGGTFEENLKLIEEGYKKGANANGDFIDQLKEYQPFIRQLGLDQSQAIALIAKSGKDGVFSDKAIDSIKEADLSLREMGKAQVEALSGIGIKPEDLIGKTTFEAIQLISSKMKGATSQARQLILADIFKGAGEDAGQQFVQELSTMDLDITKLPSVEQAGAELKGWFSEITTTVGQAFGNIGTFAQEVTPVIDLVSGMVPVYQALTSATWFQNIALKVQTAQQWLLNAAMNANPIGLIIIAIAALIAFIAVAINYWDEFGNAMVMLLGPIGMIISLIMSLREHWDSVVSAFKSDGILGGIKRLGLVILDAVLKPVQQLLQLLSKIPGLGNLAGSGAKWIEDFRKSNQLIGAGEKDKPAEKKEKDSTVNDYLKKKPDVLGAIAPDDKKKKKGKDGDGLNVGSGSNGIKSIVMNLTVNNAFSVGKGENIRNIADQITGHINDRLRDAVINLGG